MAVFGRHVRCLLVSRSVLAVYSRNAQFPSNYIQPIVDKQAIQEVKKDKEEFERLKFTPVLPAKSSQSTSVYRSEAVDRYIGILMKNGDKATALDLMRKAFLEVKKTQLTKYRMAKSDEERDAIELNPIRVFEQAMENMKPLMMTKKIKRGGATYHVPFPVRETTSRFWAMKWLNDTIRWRPRPMTESFQVVMSKELLSAFNNEGKVVKKKQDMHKLCEANKAYAHYRWG